MTELVNDSSKGEFLRLCCKEDIIACRIACLYESYSGYSGLADFWIHYNNGIPAAALARYGGALSIFCAGEQDNNELAEFSAVIGAKYLESNIKLPGTEAGGIIMKLSAPCINAGGRDESISIHWGEPDFKAAHRLLCACESESFRAPAYESFLLEASHRLRHGTSRCCWGMSGGRMISFAMTAAESSSCALIGSVCTDKTFRRKGAAGACLSALISQLRGKSIFIIRAYDENEAFYHGLGFENSGKYYFAERKN